MGDALSQQLQDSFSDAKPGALLPDATSYAAPPQRPKGVNAAVDKTYELEPEAGPSRGPAAPWPSEPLLISQLVQILATRPRNSLLLSDLGALLPANLRMGVKEKGGLRNWLQKYPVLFSVAGHPGKETVTLLLGKGDGENQQGVENAVRSGAVARVGESSIGVQDEIVSKEDVDNEAAVQLRGLPYRATVADIKAFLGRHAEVLRDESSVQLVLNRDGRPSGFARVQFSSAAAARAVREDCHMKVLTASGGGPAVNHTGGAVDAGERYVEVFLYSERPNKLRFKKTSCGDAGRDAVTAAEEIRATGISKEKVVLELRDHMRTDGKSKLLLSMLGVALSEGARLYLKRHELGLKHFLAQYPDDFVVEGAKGRELVSYLPIVCPHGSAADMATVPEPSTPRPTSAGLRGDEASDAPGTVPSAHSIDQQRPGSTSRSGQEKGSIGHLQKKEHALCDSPKPNPTAPPVHGPGDTPKGLATPSDWGTPRPHWPRSVGKTKEQRAPSAADLEANFGLGPPLALGGSCNLWPWQQHQFYQSPPFWQPHGHSHAEPLAFDPWAMLSGLEADRTALAATSSPLEVPGVSSSAPPVVGEHRPVEDVKGAAIWLRGLPFTSSEQDVLAFFAKHDVVETISEGPNAVQFVTKANGRPSGQALVQIMSEEGAEIAVQALNGQWIGTRYIEVFLQDASPGVEYIFGKAVVTGGAKATGAGGAISSPRSSSDGSVTACPGAANENATEHPKTPTPNPPRLAFNTAFARTPDNMLRLQTPESILLGNRSFANPIGFGPQNPGADWDALFNSLAPRQLLTRQANLGFGAAAHAQGESSHGGSCGGSQTRV